MSRALVSDLLVIVGWCLAPAIVWYEDRIGNMSIHGDGFHWLVVAFLAMMVPCAIGALLLAHELWRGTVRARAVQIAFCGFGVVGAALSAAIVVWAS